MIERFTLLSVINPITLFQKQFFLCLLSCLLLPGLAFAQPANDDCGSAITITNLTGGCTVYDFTGATTDLANGNCTAQGAGTPNTWFQFTAVGSELTVNSGTQGGGMEITLLEFNPITCDFGSATQLACSVSPLVTSGLVAGTTYYLVITDPGGGGVANYNVCVTSQMANPPPPNDDPCAAQVVTANGGCTNGTTVDATPDWVSGDPACAGLGENTVWYTTTLGPDSDALEVNVQGYGGNVMVLVGTFVPNCTGTLNLEDDYCGSTGGLPINVTGLSANTQYWVGIGTSTATEGTFSVCLEETGLPPGCSDNDLCTEAESIPTPTTGSACTPVPGCNIGASSEPGLTGCNFATEEVVWFTFNSDNTAGLLSASVVSNEITQPSIQVFTGNCNGLAPISDCTTGANGEVTIVNESITANSTYYIAVSNNSGPGGNFDLCVQTFADISACVTQSNLYVSPGSPSFGSPDNGPYQPGETVTMCFDLINYHADPVGSGNNCQWLQGIVPIFGDCWDPSGFDPTASTPPSLYGGNWDWHDDITYNNNSTTLTIADCDGNGITEVCHITEPSCCNTGTNANTILPPGWFADMGGSPNNTFGDGSCCNCDMGPWSFCFSLTTKLYPECDAQPSFVDCSVKVYTFADGETGSWNGGPSVCAQDVPQINNATLNCCEGPEITYQDAEVCDGGAVFMQLSSNQDPNVEYSWTVSPADSPPNPNIYGAFSGDGNTISQTLTNNTGAPVTMIYTVVGTNISEGCVGFPVDLPVTIYSEIDVSIAPPLPVCAGECTELEAFATGGSEIFVNYEWDQGLPQGSPLVNACPTTTTVYSVTVTDNLGCTGETSVTVNANSNLIVELTPDPGLVSCEDFNNPPTIQATVTAGGSGSYGYQWSNSNGAGGNSDVEVIFDSDTYCVEVTDFVTGCSGTQCIDMVVNPLPFVIIIDPPGQLCASSMNYCFDAIPEDGTNGGSGIWGGLADPNGCIDPSSLGAGFHQVTYSFTDENGCFDMAVYDFTVTQLPPAPDPLNDVTLCSGVMPQVYTVNAVSGAFTYTWTVPADAMITNGQSTTDVTIDWTGSAGGQVCVTADNDCGSGPQTCFNVTIGDGPNDPTPPNDTSFCSNTPLQSFSIAPVTGASSYIWSVPAGVNITGGQTTTAVTVDWGTAGSGQICVIANNACGSSAQVCSNVTINTEPATPSTPGSINVCEGATNQVYTIPMVATATGYTWTIPTGATIVSGDGTNAITIDWQTASSGQICVSADNDCGSSPLACFDVTIDTAPEMPLPPPNSNVCSGTANTNYAISPVADADSYNWTVPTGATITNGAGTTSINVDWGTATTGTICVSAQNNCGVGPQACFEVTIDDIPLAPTPPADALICAGAQGETYSVADVATATSYTWTVPTGASIASGQGTTDIEIDWAANATSGQICVTADNNCGMSPQACFQVDIDNVPPAATPPGDNVVCEGLQDDPYSVTAVVGAIDYTWTVPNNAAITSGQGTTDIEIDWGTSAGGQVCVTTSNNCGDGPETCFDVTVNTSPQAPIAPADATVCQGTQDDAYSINPVAGANNYTWTVPADATITAGQGTTDIEIDWGTATTGDVCVSADNDCGSSPLACFEVVIDEVPESPTLPADNAVCQNTLGEDYSIVAVTGANGYTWSTTGGATITNGQGTTNITVDYGTAADATICVTADNDCGSSPEVCFTTTINPIPNALFDVETPICLDGTSTINYIGTGSPAAIYTWNFNGGNNTTGASDEGPYVIDWNTAGTYTVSLTVSENGCESAPQTLDVVVEAPLAIPVINCNTTTSSVEFTWNDIPGATGYLVNGNPNAGTTYEETGLNAGDPVTITVTALSNGACGNSEATQTCVAEDCPMVQIDIDPVANICLDNNTTPITLTANVVGGTGGTGTWTGTGITDANAGTFDPNAANFGNNAITYTYVEGPCMYSQSIDIAVNEQPTADFVVPSPICSEDTITISYTGTATATADYNWNFDGADYIAGTGSGPYEIHWPAGADQNVTLTVTSLSGCPSEEVNQTVVIDAPLAIPNIICESATDNITFTWDAIPGATNYIVNGTPQTDNFINISGLNAGDMETITVVAVGAGSCGNSQATQTCTADDCPAVQIDIDAVAEICLDANAMAFNLNAVVGGTGNGTGQWQGPGIVDAATGLFDPNAATVNAGINTVTYFYQEGTCNYDASIDIVVNPQPDATFTVDASVCAGDNVMVAFTGTYNAVDTYIWDFGNGTVINDLGSENYEVQLPTAGMETITLQVISNNCGSEIASEEVQVDAPLAVPNIICNTTTTSVTFTWDAIAGANGYTVNGTPQGGTTYTEAGLTTGEMVTIEVVALGAGACGNSSATQTCTAEDCAPIQVSIDPVNAFCQDPAVNPVMLNAVVVGGAGGTGLWSGNGITDSANGTFDPNAPGVMTGVNQITYTYAEPPCNYTATLDIMVNELPSADFTIDAIACVGDEVSVSYAGTYSGTAAYNWNFGGATIVADLGQENYTLSFPNGGMQNISLEVISNGCNSGEETQSIQIDEPLAEPNIICEPTLNSVNFTWAPVVGATGYIVNGTPQAATNFEFTGLAAGDIVNITVVAVGNGPCGNSTAMEQCEASECPPVALTIDAVGDICKTDTPSGIIDLEVAIVGGTGQGTGEWVGNGITNATTGTFNPNDAALINGANEVTFNYTEDGCDFSESITINIFDQPTANAGMPQTLSCANDQMVTLTASGSGTPSWSGPSVQSGGDSFNPVVDAAGLYILTITDPATGCTNTSQVNIVADNSVPTADAGLDTVLNCNNDATIDLMAGGTLGADYEVTWEGPAITAANMNEENPSIDQPGMYILTIENTVFNCFSEPDTMLVQMDTLPPNAVIQFTGSLDCFNQSVLLTADVDLTHDWSWLDPEGNTSTEQTIEAQLGGTYVLFVLDPVNGCTNLDTAIIDDLTAYPIALAGDDQELDCANPTVILDGNASQSGPTIIYQWQGPSGGIVGNNMNTTADATLPGMYILSVTDTDNNCMNSDTVFVTEDLNAPIAEAGDALEFGCSDESLSLDGGASSGADLYEWTDADGNTFSNTVSAEVSTPGTYYLTVINADNDCEATDSIFVSPPVNLPSDIVFDITQPSCFGDDDGVINVTEVIGGTAPYSYTLDGEFIQDFGVLSFLEGDVNYNLTIEDAEGCVYETEIYVPQPAELSISFNADLSINLGNTTDLNPTYSINDGAIDTVIWTPLEYLDCNDSLCYYPTTDSLMYYTTTFSATMIDTFGCQVTEEIEINVSKDRPVYIPNAFSPNNDNVNELFIIQAGADSGIEEINYLRIFNRWGEIVFEAENFQPDDPRFGWDGTFKGEEMNNGVFIFVTEVEFVDGFKILYKGDITLMK